MNMLPVQVKRLYRMSGTIPPRPVVVWVATVLGVPVQFSGRTQAEAVGRAVLHLIGRADPDAAKANAHAEGGVN